MKVFQVPATELVNFEPGRKQFRIPDRYGRLGLFLSQRGISLLKRSVKSPSKLFYAGIIHNSILIVVSFLTMCGAIYGASVRVAEDGSIFDSRRALATALSADGSV